jgi:hypothetical protein
MHTAFKNQNPHCHVLLHSTLNNPTPVLVDAKAIMVGAISQRSRYFPNPVPCLSMMKESDEHDGREL